MATRGPSGAAKAPGELPLQILEACRADAVLKSWVQEFTLTTAQAAAVGIELRSAESRPVLGAFAELEEGGAAARALEWALHGGHPARKERRNRRAIRMAKRSQGRGDVSDDTDEEATAAAEAKEDAEWRLPIEKPCDNDWEIEQCAREAFADGIDLWSADPSINSHPTTAEVEEAQAALKSVLEATAPDPAAPLYDTSDDSELQYPVFLMFRAQNDNMGVLENGGIILEEPTRGCYFETTAFYD